MLQTSSCRGSCIPSLLVWAKIHWSERRATTIFLQALDKMHNQPLCPQISPYHTCPSYLSAEAETVHGYVLVWRGKMPNNQTFCHVGYMQWHYLAFESTYSSADGQQSKCQESDLVAVLLNFQAHPILWRDWVPCFNGMTCLLSYPTFHWVSIRGIFPFQFSV